MSIEIVDAIFDYAETRQQPIMIIASRNQIGSGGYVCTTEELMSHIKDKSRSYIKICRDHCGPYFNDSEKSLSFREAIEATKKTIANDIENGFDLIHIDTSRCGNDFKSAASELFDFAQKMSDTVEFEFGTEENVGVSASVNKYEEDCKLARSLSDRIRFVVGQTGSLVYEDFQIGKFDPEVAMELSEIADNYGVKLKEHNADYIGPAAIDLRRLCGVYALNIAPEFGVIQTKLLYELAPSDLWKDFADLGLKSERWKKWIDASRDDLKKVLVSGHYLFSTVEYKKIIDNIGENEFRKDLRERLFNRFDTYSKYMKL